MGRVGQHNEYLFRGEIQCMARIISNDTKEAVYLNTRYDKNGNLLNGGAGNYILHLTKDQLPKVDAFWSLTMYGMDFNLVGNSINRYSIGNRTVGVKKDNEGGLTIYIQKENPGKDSESNWLPAPDGEFLLILRCYIPHREIYEQQWYPPGIEKK